MCGNFRCLRVEVRVWSGGRENSSRGFLPRIGGKRVITSVINGELSLIISYANRSIKMLYRKLNRSDATRVHFTSGDLIGPPMNLPAKRRKNLGVEASSNCFINSGFNKRQFIFVAHEHNFN